MKNNLWKYLAWTGGTLLVAIVCVVCVQRIHAGATEPHKDDPDNDAYKISGDGVITADDDATKTAGIRTMSVKAIDVPETLTLTGRTGLDMENVSHVHAQFGGKVTQVAPELGAMVKGPEAPGGPTTLCVIESNDLAQAKANYLQAKVQLKLDDENLGRTRELVKSTVLADKFLLDAQSAVTKDRAILEATRQQLLVFGLNQKEIEQVDAQQGRQRMDYVITSPRSGVVAEKGVSGGEVADPTVNLFTIADTSSMWVWGDVYERDLRRIKVGDPMQVIVTSDPDHPRNCKIDWISPVLDPNTHSIRVRGKLANPDGHLLADMYGTLVVTVNPGKNSIVVPADCVVRQGTDAFVFAVESRGGGRTEYRRVKVQIAPVDVGFGISDSAVAATSAGRDTSRSGADDTAARPIRVVQGLRAGQIIVQSGALGLFNEMEQHARPG